MPAIQREFDSSQAEVQWVVGAYLLSLASLMAGSGRLADLFGRRRLFLLGIAVFGVSSLACAVAPSELALIVARLVQGAGAPLTQPLALANATAIMPPEWRGGAIGVLASAGTTCLMVGFSRPFVFTPASTGLLKVIPADERGLASSLVTESRQLGAVLGVAALGAIAAAFESGEGAGAALRVSRRGCSRRPPRRWSPEGSRSPRCRVAGGLERHTDRP